MIPQKMKRCGKYRAVYWLYHSTFHAVPSVLASVRTVGIHVTVGVGQRGISIPDRFYRAASQRHLFRPDTLLFASIVIFHRRPHRPFRRRRRRFLPLCKSRARTLIVRLNCFYLGWHVNLCPARRDLLIGPVDIHLNGEWPGNLTRDAFATFLLLLAFVASRDEVPPRSRVLKEDRCNTFLLNCRRQLSKLWKSEEFT